MLNLHGPYARWNVPGTAGVSHCFDEMVLPRIVVEPTLGHFEFGAIHRQITKSAAAGKKLVLGIVSCDPWDQDRLKWVPDGVPGAWIAFKGRRVFSADEDHEDYPAPYRAMMKALGSEVDADLLGVEFRSWCGGEGTNGGLHSDAAPPIGTVANIRTIDVISEFFPKSFKIVPTDDPIGYAYAIKHIPGCGAIRCSLGNPWFDTGLHAIGFVAGSRLLLSEPYGGSGVNLALAAHQLQAWRGLPGDWNLGDALTRSTKAEIDAYFSVAKAAQWRSGLFTV